ncbi:hypothetical protein [Paenisporosarcina cavernae]|uniref:Uncharacterized protein n=1 Tax=Paenisporosarcina cavernae TaxID=2320858 RepID=A0A385YQR6_9BACL|nr:hypothetical protein [Paenisporosarcina cavernae]AYC28730.1 hypothetical protein D3873_02145 [Paenisporosarcina cavernae]
MQSFSHPLYSREDLLNVIHGVHGSRAISFRYDLLDKKDNKLKELYSVIDGEVSMSSLAQIKRTAKFTIQDQGDIDYLSNRIQPWIIFKMPKMMKRIDTQTVNVPSQNIEFPLGVFLLGSPTRKEDSNSVIRQVDAYDGLLVLRDDKFDSRYFIAAGTNYRNAVISILESAGIDKHNIEETNNVLPTDLEFEPGKEKLFSINELLGAINFTPIHVDVYGYYTSIYYRSPSVRAAEYVYADDIKSILSAGMEEELNLVETPNRWVVTVSNPEQEPLISTYTNDNSNSPTSTINRGRKITDFRQIENIADQNSLNGYVQRIAFEASQVYGKLKFSTAINPLHDYADVLEIIYSPLGIKDKYSETSWTIPLRAGALMSHEVRKVVQI